MSLSRVQRWLPWLLGLAVLAAVVVAALHLAEERAFVRLVRDVKPALLFVAVALQAATYLAQAATWLTVLNRGDTRISLTYASALGLQKLFVDQALPSLGLSGTAAVVESLESRGVPRPAVMAAVTVDVGCYFAAYVVSLGSALLIFIFGGHASVLVMVASLAFLLLGGALAATILTLGAQRGGRLAPLLAKVPGIRQVVTWLRESDPRLARDPRLLLRATLLQLGIFLLDAATLWVLIQALGDHTGPAPVFASFMLASLLRSVGLMPGGLGTFEAASVSTLVLVGVPVAIALSATLLFRGLSFWLPMIPGLAISRRAIVTHHRVTSPDSALRGDHP